MAKEQFELYNKEVILVTDTEAERSRYRVWDKKNGKDNEPVRGVTTVLGNVFDKPGLRMYPLNEAMKYLFGAKFDDVQKKLVVDENAIIPDLTKLEDRQKVLDDCYDASKAKATKGKDTGSEIHRLIELFLKNKTTTKDFADPVAVNAKNAFVGWYKSQNIKVLKVEQPVYSRSYEFAGRFDALLEIDGKIHLVDIKTTNISSYGLKKGKDWTGIYPDNFLQMGAYSRAYAEELGIDHQGAGSYQGPASAMDKKIDDLTVINVTKDGKLQTISASELGLTVERLENAAQATMKLHNLLSEMCKVKPLNVWQEVDRLHQEADAAEETGSNYTADRFREKAKELEKKK